MEEKKILTVGKMIAMSILHGGPETTFLAFFNCTLSVWWAVCCHTTAHWCMEDVPDMLTQKVGNHFSFHDMATHNYFVHKNFIKIDGINCSYK